ncbi:MAG: NAD-dependent epimerase/dehydratase family protein [Candidatus Asgardarchaeia archaeon]
MLKGKKILVTGGSGFIGTNLIKRLVDLGANVKATLHRKGPQFENENISFVWGDLTDKNFCNKICKNQDYVFMCAANTSGAAVMEYNPLAHVTPNVLINTLMLEAAYHAKVKKFLFVSSTTVYPLVDFPLKEEDDNGEFFHKYFCVASMKKFSEVMCEMYSTKIKNPMTTIVARVGNLYGEYDDYEWETSHSTAALIRRVVERHDPIGVWGDGLDSKDITYISDMVDGLILAMEKVDGFDIINLASGESHTIKKTLDVILKIDGYENANIVFDKSKPTMIPRRAINIDKAIKMLGFNPQTSLEEGIRKTVEWYKRIKK